MPSSNTDFVLFDTTAQRIDPSSLGSCSRSTRSNQVNGVLFC